jgi:hypothetical protein
MVASRDRELKNQLALAFLTSIPFEDFPDLPHEDKDNLNLNQQAILESLKERAEDSFSTSSSGDESTNRRLAAGK